MKTISDAMFKEIISLLRHASKFVSSNEKMSDDGISAYKKFISNIESLDQPSEDSFLARKWYKVDHIFTDDCINIDIQKEKLQNEYWMTIVKDYESKIKKLYEDN